MLAASEWYCVLLCCYHIKASKRKDVARMVWYVEIRNMHDVVAKMMSVAE